MAGGKDDFESTTLWQRTLARRDDSEEPQREKLRQAFLDFRGRVALLISHIRTELPDLTLHDITHVDALWRVASEVIGDAYPINPAEAFVLGGAFLLHDAAHCRAAFFNGGLEEIRQTPQWQDAAALAGCNGQTLSEADPQFQRVLFDTLRVLHPLKAEDLPVAAWGDKPSNTQRLLPDDELRDAYGHVIGQVARSHWQSPHELEPFADQCVTAPVCLSPCSWEVNPLKLALILRTADALHMDAKRAPRFLMQIAPPQSRVSAEHWKFQSRLNMVKRDDARQEIKITGAPFKTEDQQAWWLAYDAARLADRELDAAWLLLREKGLPSFAVREVAGVRSPHAFSNYVPAQGWLPVDTEIRISQIHQLVENFGGAKLYGDEPHWALRELLQNALDAVHAWRKLAGVQGLEGEIEVALEPATEDQCWLHVTDTGIGMSRYVLTQVLLDFGRSLWGSPELSAEWQGLAASKFEAIGQFGIGFFSVFMLGQQVKVTTRRYEPKAGEPEQHVLEFCDGTKGRPLLRPPTSNERLRVQGTRVSVLITSEVLFLLGDLGPLLARLAPAIDVNLYLRSTATTARELTVAANDWLRLDDDQLIERLYEIKPSDKYGKPIVLTPLVSDAGEIIGRLGVRRFFNTRWIPGLSVGVINGLFAGGVEGGGGILFCSPQNDLARGEATPRIVWKEVREWAELHKLNLLRHKALSHDESRKLLELGADRDGLILVRWGGHQLSIDQVASRMASMEELIIYSGEIDLHNENDLTPAQRNEFEVNPDLIEIEEVNVPSWVLKIRPWKSKKIVEEILADLASRAWGEGVEWSNEYTLIGECDGHEIWRSCSVARRSAGSAGAEATR